MPEQQQVTSGAADWEARYKELQADHTRKAQQIAEYERMRNEGQLIEKATYDDYLVKWASENPDAALEVFPALKDHVLRSGNGAAGSKALGGTMNSTGAFDDAIFDQSSEQYQKFVQEHGQKGYRQALLSKMAPELLESTGLGRELNELREFKQSYEAEREEMRERLDRAEKYALSSFDQVQLSQDPRRKQIRDLQEKLRETKGEAWYEVVEKLNKLEELAKQQAAPPPAAPAAPDPQAQAPTPEQLANRIDQASVVPQGAGSGAGPVPSQAQDPFDAALAKADPALAQKLGIFNAA